MPNDYADYLKARVASSKKIDGRVGQARREASAMMSGEVAPGQRKTIRLAFDEERDYDTELQSLFLDYLDDPAVARRLVENPGLSDDMKEWLTNNWVEIAPGLDAFRGRRQNVASIIAFLKQKYEKSDLTTRQATAVRAAAPAPNHIWKTGRVLDPEEREVFADYVFQAKAAHNGSQLQSMNLPTADRNKLVDAFLAIYQIDRVRENIAPYISKKIRGKLGDGYSADMAAESNAMHTNLFGKNVGELSGWLRLYADEVETYATLQSAPVAVKYPLARAIWNNEKNALTPLVDALVEAKPHVFADGSVISTVAGKEVPGAAAAASAAAAAPSAPAAAPAPAPAPAPASVSSSKAAAPPAPAPASSLFSSIAAPTPAPTPVPAPATASSSSGPALITPQPSRIPVSIARSRSGTMTGSGAAQPKRSGEFHFPNGKYFLELNKLVNHGVLSLRYSRNRHLVPIKVQSVSPLFRDLVLSRVRGDEALDRSAFNSLSDTEKHLFRSIAKYIDHTGGSLLADLPDPSEAMSERFQVVFGALRAGHNSPEVKKEAFQLLRHAYTLGKVSQSDYAALIRNYNL